MIFSLQINTYVKKNGTQALRLKVSTSNKDTQYIDTGVSIKKTQWDSNKELVKKHTLEEQLNAKLNTLKTKVQKIYYENKGISAKRLLQIYKANIKYNTESFIDFYQSTIDEDKLRKKFRTAKTKQHYLDKLKMFSNFISFSDINHQFLKDYEIWLLKRDNRKNTIASNLRSIITVLNTAVRNGLIKENLARGYKIEKENTVKQSLNLEEIQKIADLDIPKRFKAMNVARDMFLFCFYSAGMRFTDMCLLKWKNIKENNIVYTMNKVKDRIGATRTIPLNPKSRAILEKYKGLNNTYVFPPLYKSEFKDQEQIEYNIYIKNNNLNRALKIVANQCDIDKRVSMHMGKHSFADYAVKSEVSLLMISKLLGHTRLETTQHYLKDFYHKEESDTINKLFG
ncbi:site-specific recombinase [Tenacibaculum sp. SZ-18]|uniref:site-specific integrase n=1 Tax=Tenacibaculum sp. SZ-18 TaxID=754423 RepID=UPI000C2CE535|nr:site-specific integrase [Tenacibaculum sp. SZ-18]AUC14401.1 site-specific recombinase [Tenacibaculum sp. SZ-18]